MFAKTVLKKPVDVSGLLRVGALAVAMGGAATLAAPASAGVTASAAVSNMYLWRGLDLGDGDAAVSGDIRYTLDTTVLSGAYVGVWMSSGDAQLGNEYDYYAGYGMKAGDFTFDLSLWNYNYSDASLNTPITISKFGGLLGTAKGVDVSDDTTGELSEIIFTVGYAGLLSFSYYDNIAGGSGYEYYTLTGNVNKFSLTVGHHDMPSGGNDMTHVNLTYAFNSNLSFTVSKVVDQDSGAFMVNGSGVANSNFGAFDEDVKFVVTYSLPISI